MAKAKKSLFAILLENEGRSSIISLLPPSSLLARRSQSHVSCILNQFPSSQTRTVLRATSLLLMDPGLHFQNDTKGKKKNWLHFFFYQEETFFKASIKFFPNFRLAGKIMTDLI